MAPEVKVEVGGGDDDGSGCRSSNINSNKIESIFVLLEGMAKYNKSHRRKCG